MIRDQLKRISNAFLPTSFHSWFAQILTLLSVANARTNKRLCTPGWMTFWLLPLSFKFRIVSHIKMVFHHVLKKRIMKNGHHNSIGSVTYSQIHTHTLHYTPTRDQNRNALKVANRSWMKTKHSDCTLTWLLNYFPIDIFIYEVFIYIYEYIYYIIYYDIIYTCMLCSINVSDLDPTSRLLRIHFIYIHKHTHKHKYIFPMYNWPMYSIVHYCNSLYTRFYKHCPMYERIQCTEFDTRLFPRRSSLYRPHYGNIYDGLIGNRWWRYIGTPMLTIVANELDTELNCTDTWFLSFFSTTAVINIDWPWSSMDEMRLPNIIVINISHHHNHQSHHHHHNYQHYYYHYQCRSRWSNSEPLASYWHMSYTHSPVGRFINISNLKWSTCNTFHLFIYIYFHLI